jgi:hypothetical protein
MKCSQRETRKQMEKQTKKFCVRLLQKSNVIYLTTFAVFFSIDKPVFGSITKIYFFIGQLVNFCHKAHFQIQKMKIKGTLKIMIFTFKQT